MFNLSSNGSNDNIDKNLEKTRLNAVQLFEALEGRLRPLGQVGDRDQSFVLLERRGLQSRNVDFFVAYG